VITGRGVSQGIIHQHFHKRTTWEYVGVGGKCTLSVKNVDGYLRIKIFESTLSREGGHENVYSLYTCENVDNVNDP
jgi:hypothetical protein